jgi:hypothetical protein
LLDHWIYDGDNYIIREQQEIIRLLREQNEALQREVVLLEQAQRSGEKLRLWKAQVDLAACLWEFCVHYVSQLVYAIKHADGFVEVWYTWFTARFIYDDFISFFGINLT